VQFRKDVVNGAGQYRCVDCLSTVPLSHKCQFNHLDAASGKTPCKFCIRRAMCRMAVNIAGSAYDRRAMSAKLALQRRFARVFGKFVRTHRAESRNP
jgi:hypothetical protein